MSHRLRRVKTLGTRLVSQQIGPSEELLWLLARLETFTHLQTSELMKQVGISAPLSSSTG